MADRAFASEAAQRLAALYGSIEARLAGGIAGRLARGIAGSDWAERRLAELGEVRRWAANLIGSASPAADRLARQALMDALAHGAERARTDAPGRGQVYRSDPTARTALLANRLRGAERYAVEAAAQAYRSAVLAGGIQLTGTGDTELSRRRSVQRALNQAMESGITGFTDRAGRRWSLAGYVEMAAQTAATQAAIDGQLGQMRADGRNLLIVSSGPQECERCRRWMGKILTVDSSGLGGTTVVVPSEATPERMVTVRAAGSLAEARVAGLFHPRCRCRLGTYRVGLTGRPVTRPDPEGQKARDRLRALERRVRELRLREAAALDDAARAEAREKRIAKQAEITAHVAASANLGIRRDQRRERVDIGYRAVS